MSDDIGQQPGPPQGRRRLALVIGGVVTILCLIAAFYGIDFSTFWAAIYRADVWLLILSALVGLASFNVRAVRWQQILGPVKAIGHVAAYDAVMVGFLGNSVLPARAGELIRAHVLGRREGVSRAAAFGSIVAERLLDAITLLAVAAVTVWLYPFPDEVRAKVHVGLGVAAGIIAVVMLVVCFRSQLHALGTYLARLLPASWRERTQSVASSLVDGGQFLRQPLRTASVIALSAAAWAMVLLSIWLSLEAVHLDVPVTASGLVLVATALGMLIPAAPGGVGTFEFALVVALGYVGVARSEAGAYAVLLHVSQLVPGCLVGAVCAWRCQVRLSRPA